MFCDGKRDDNLKDVLDKIYRQIDVYKRQMRESNKTACDYCAYKDVCRFDEKYGNNRYHYTKHSAKEKEQLLEDCLLYTSRCV